MKPTALFLTLTIFMQIAHYVHAENPEKNQNVFNNEIREDPLREYEYIQIGEYKVVMSGLKKWDMEKVMDETANSLQIFKDGIEVYKESQGFKYFHNGYCMVDNDKETCIPKLNSNFTGGTEPVLIFVTFSGGAHCCFAYHFYALGTKLVNIANIETEDGYIRFKDIDKDGKLELIINDWSFGYQWTSFAHSPAPEVILKWETDKFTADFKLMKKPYEEVIGSTKYKSYDLTSNEKYRAACDLIYTGNGNKAWDILCAGLKGRERNEAVKKYKADFSKSPFWEGIKVMNGWN